MFSATGRAAVTGPGAAPFDSGHEHFDALTPGVWAPIGEATVRVTRPRTGEHVLDACCGAGASALPAAAAVGPRGRVDAVDLSEGLLARGRSRAGGLPQLTFHRHDVATWTGGPYDLVQCVLGIFFLPDMVAGARTMAARLRPGGRFAVTVFAEGANAPLPQVLAAATAPEHVVPPPPGPAARVNTPEALTDLLGTAGLADVRVERVPITLALDPDLAWSLVLGSAMRGQLSGLDDRAVERVEERFRTAIDFGSIDVSVLVGIGRNPT